MSQETKTWPELAIGLYEQLTGKNATINYNFKDFKIDVPSKVGSDEFASWKIDGQLEVSTSENGK